MTRRISAGAALALLALGASTASLGTVTRVAASPPAGFVYRNGTQLMLNGSAHRFHGLDIYAANSRQGTATSQPGPSSAGFWCGDDFSAPQLDQSLSAIGTAANASRSWFFQSFATVNGARSWSTFDQTLSTFAAHGVKVIVSLAEGQGSCEAASLRLKDYAWYTGGYKTAIQPGYIQTYYDYVRDVVTRYAGHSEILAWQLMSEGVVYGCPSETAGAAAMRAWIDDVAGLVKSIDPNHLVSGGATPGGICGARLDASTSGTGLSDYAYVEAGPNTDICNEHDYTNPQNTIATYQKQEHDNCAAIGKPWIVDELGIVVGNVGWTYPDGHKIAADPTDPTRTHDLKAKFDAQFAYGSQGELMWEFGIALCDQFCVKAGDPVLSVLSQY